MSQPLEKYHHKMVPLQKEPFVVQPVVFSRKRKFSSTKYTPLMPNQKFYVVFLHQDILEISQAYHFHQKFHFPFYYELMANNRKLSYGHS